MTVVGVVSPGQMGAGLGHDLAAGGARVVATTAGRSARTRRLAEGLELLPSLDDVVAASDIVLLVTPPGRAPDAAREVAEAARRTGATPLVADLNAVSPPTMAGIAATLAPLDVVDGSISGPPPTVRPGATLYLSGRRAAEIAGLPWTGARPAIVGADVGAASAVKMCTASVQKGLWCLVGQALATAAANGVLDPVRADITAFLRVEDLARPVASGATKAHRYVAEMREIAATQRAAGLPGELFDGFAVAYAALAGTGLAEGDPESVGPITPDQAVRLMAVRTRLDAEPLRTARLLLTPLTEADANALAGVLDDERLYEFIGGHPATPDELRRRYATMLAGPDRPGEFWLNWVVRRDDGTPVGTAQATVTGDAAEVAWVVGVPWQGRGYATEAARALVGWLRARGVRSVSANVHPDHHASATVAVRAGLTVTGDEVDGERVWRSTS